MNYTTRDFSRLLNKPIIDIRHLSEYKKCHIRGASHFSIINIEARLHELPMNSTALNLFGEVNDLLKATELLKAKNYQIESIIESTPSVINKIKSLGLAEDGDFSKRLWCPSDVVTEFIQSYSTEVSSKIGLDLACGSGRDSVFMSINGWSMTSVDYKKSSLDKLNDFSAQHNQKISTLSIDLENDFSQILALKQQFDAIILVRYLHRPMLSHLEQIIKKNGFIVYQTFMQGCEKFGSPKNPRFLLKKGELAEIFSDFKVVLDQVVYLQDGRPTNCFIAQKN